MIKEARGDSYVVLFSFAFFEQLGSEFLSFARSLLLRCCIWFFFFRSFSHFNSPLSCNSSSAPFVMLMAKLARLSTSLVQ